MTVAVLSLIWDAETAVAPETFYLSENWPYVSSRLEYQGPHHPGGELLVNGQPWSDGMTLKCKDRISYRVTKSFPSPAFYQVTIDHSDVACKD